MSLQAVKDVASTKVWGEHSLTIGGIAAFAIGVVLMIFKPLGTWSMYIGLAVILAGMALF